MKRLIFCHSSSVLRSKKYYFIMVKLDDYQKQMMTWRAIACYMPVVVLDDGTKPISDLDAELDNLSVITLKS